MRQVVLQFDGVKKRLIPARHSSETIREKKAKKSSKVNMLGQGLILSIWN